MSPKISTEREHQQRETILQAATACFSEKGYHRTTIQDICDGAKLSKGGLYTYFKSKEEILAAVVEDSVQSTFRQVIEVAGTGGRVPEKLDRIASTILERLTSDKPTSHSPQLSFEIWAEASKNPQVKASCVRSYAQWRTFLTDLLREGIVKGEFKTWVDPEALAAILVAVFDGLSLQEGITRARVDWQRITQMLRRGLAEGIIT